jgi:hypothetical protein
MILTPPKVPEPGFYYHYKHDPAKGSRDYAYEVLSVGFHSEEDGVCFVNYRPLYESAGVYQASRNSPIQFVDNRPLEMWMGNVEKDGKTFPRFKKITDSVVIAELKKARVEMYPDWITP